ncbi:hypothetical protein KUCAC02_031342, partial [Chaenocephalus aceratus]
PSHSNTHIVGLFWRVSPDHTDNSVVCRVPFKWNTQSKSTAFRDITERLSLQFDCLFNHLHHYKLTREAEQLQKDHEWQDGVT